MWERMLILAAAFGGILVYDGITLRNKLTRREKWIYAALLTICLYMSVDYVLNQDWLDMYDLMDPILGGLAKQIDGLLKVDWEG